MSPDATMHFQIVMSWVSLRITVNRSRVRAGGVVKGKGVMGSQQPWQVLSCLPAWQVTEIPRPRGDGDGGDWGAEERFAALASAYGCGGPVAVAWIRDRPGGPVRVLAAGTDDGQVVLA